MNWEVGAKMKSANNKVVGTVSLFRGERTNQMLDDSAKQSNLEEPLNFSTTLFAPGSVGYNTRVFRWRTTNLKNRIEGTEGEVIWSPTTNFQAVVNGSGCGPRKRYTTKRATSPARRPTMPPRRRPRLRRTFTTARIENVPEYKFTVFGKYTLNDGAVRGLGLGAGMRYSSKTVVSRSVDWNPLDGGYQAGDYVVFDFTANYPWSVGASSSTRCSGSTT